LTGLVEMTDEWWIHNINKIYQYIER
jgi:hypothetical protein